MKASTRDDEVQWGAQTEELDRPTFESGLPITVFYDFREIM